MKGVVMRSTGSFYEVLGENQKTYTCRVRGKIRLEGIKETNPIAVGDRVEFDTEHEVGSITSILPRTNHMLRKSVKKTGHSHVLSANIDQVLLVATMAMPRTSLGFIDRFIISAEAFRIPQILVFNKSDLLSTEERNEQIKLIALYEGLGITCLVTSSKDGSQKKIESHINGKTTLFAGHSGVGKSTILNQIAPGLDQKVGAISDFSEKGTHTTTFAEMFQLDTNTFVIDTPGVKEWGLVDMNQQEISDYFAEMREVRLGCKFGARCLHINEPHCKVIEAVRSGKIALSRYESYLSMMADDDNRK
jgi:ribosome biogenesis GTPase / thiamine phosphate phosphatase